MGDFSYGHILWILHHYQELRSGFNPNGQPETVRTKINRRLAPGIYFIEMAGEVSARVRLCGMDGYLVEERFGMKNGVKHEVSEIAQMRHLEAKQVNRRIRQVISYCEGEARKKEAYPDWKSKHRFERRMR